MGNGAACPSSPRSPSSIRPWDSTRADLIGSVRENTVDGPIRDVWLCQDDGKWRVPYAEPISGGARLSRCLTGMSKDMRSAAEAHDKCEADQWRRSGQDDGLPIADLLKALILRPQSPTG